MALKEIHESRQGRFENSPPFQRRVTGNEKKKSPQGTNEIFYNFAPMAHTYISILVHVVFSTHLRKPLISEDLQTKLWPYIGGIARENHFKALAVGGMPDHTHVLLSLPATLPIAKAVQLIKGGSSKWINDQRLRRNFAWQDAYGAFSIGVSQVKATIRYINTQKQHHAKRSFDDELKLILKKHQLLPVPE